MFRLPRSLSERPTFSKPMYNQTYQRALMAAQGLKVYDFECLRCGRCCQHNVVDLMPSEMVRIKYLARKMNKQVLITPCQFDTGAPIYKMLANPCQFWIGGKCSIHNEKPLMCKAYPIRPHPSKFIIDFGCEWGAAIIKDFGSDCIPIDGMEQEKKAARLMAKHLSNGVLKVTV